jgi:hypothetical protein
MSLTFADRASPFQYRLNFKFASQTNQYFFRSFVKDPLEDISSPVL